MKILVINGPNLNMLGIREKNIYGDRTLKDLENIISKRAKGLNCEVEFFQSNHEGALIDRIQEAYYEKIDGIIINPAAYTHTSVALLDALKAVSIPAVEVHLSNVSQREDFRQLSYIRKICRKTITGKGFDGYIEALEFLVSGN